MTTDLVPMFILAAFLVGYVINKNRSVLVAVTVAVFLGVLASGGWLGGLVHNLVVMYHQIT